jgi:hypothetical protein
MEDDIYELLLRKGYARSGRFVSQHYCRRSPNYIAMTGGDISDSAGLEVARQLAVEHRWLTALRVLLILFWRRQYDDEAAA